MQGLPGLGVCRAPLEWGGSVEAPRYEGAEAIGAAVKSLEGCPLQTSSGCRDGHRWATWHTETPATRGSTERQEAPPREVNIGQQSGAGYRKGMANVRHRADRPRLEAG